MTNKSANENTISNEKLEVNKYKFIIKVNNLKA